MKHSQINQPKGWGFLILTALILISGCSQDKSPITSRHYEVHKDISEIYSCEQIRDACILDIDLKTTATYFYSRLNGTNYSYNATFVYNMENVCKYYYVIECMEVSLNSSHN